MEEKFVELAEPWRRDVVRWRSCGGEIWAAGGAVEKKFGELAELWSKSLGTGGAVEETFGELVGLGRRNVESWRSCGGEF